MVEYQEARRIIRKNVTLMPKEEIALHEGIGRVLLEDWYCDRDMPPYDRVTMDGIALNANGLSDVNDFKIEGVIAAGDEKGRLNDVANAVEIMTGAVLPEGADTIVRYEDVRIHNNRGAINAPFTKGQNIHRQGSDRKKGDLIVSSGQLLSASEIGVGASIGKHRITVAKRPMTIVISTGDELVPINQNPEVHQIRRSNVYRIASTLAHMGIPATTAHLTDDLALIKTSLFEYIQTYDCIILSGGVSKGKFDFLPEALAQCGVHKHFHKIAQRPGKPMWFGTHKNGCTVFALPGNPVSSFMCFTIYVKEWFRYISGLNPNALSKAILSDDVYFKPDLTYFLEVSLTSNEAGHQIATPHKGNGSGDLANLIKGDAFIELPRGHNHYRKGSVYNVYRYRDM